ncbi:ATPase domain-containing protein [Hansschlegelia sp. KR7-227]|jgi:circadian clock protein KaiC|uniref:ATPase domain-containing protein n=1 Tax=Hansschlegelia sp. KR7-227 TaxID=3400914 RepID=UPI003C055855
MAGTDGRTSSGNEGLDGVLRGGLVANRLYLLEGSPGSGKTTLALQFLLDGADRGEPGLYVTLSETDEELRGVAAAHGWSLDKISIFELAAAEEAFGAERQQSILHPWENELGGTIKLIKDQVQRIKPRRVVFDSLSEMRLLAQDPLRYRRQVLALKQFFAPLDVTVFIVDDLTGEEVGQRDAHLHSLCHGVITLQRLTLEFGAARRRLEVQKLRGVDFIGGYHDFVIRKGGLEIYPRLIASDHEEPFIGDPVQSGVTELDELMGGGPRRGTTTLVSGPAGAGKTTISLQYIFAACERGERCAIYEFDERIGTMLSRSKAMGLDLARHIEAGRLAIQQIHPAEISPGEFAWRVRREVETQGARLVLIDSLNGYMAAMPQEQQLVLQVHELLSYLNQRGVTTLLINPQSGLVGSMTTGTINISYVSDAVILIRFFEAEGRIRKAISILKNRSGEHEDVIRELRIDSRGVRVGAPLSEFRGVLTGTPQYVGPRAPLMEDRGAGR